MSEEAYRNYPKPRRLKYYADLYGEFHTENPKRLSGKIHRSQTKVIIECVDALRTYHATSGHQLRLLDYGSGKGYQYLSHRVHEAWGGILPYCYDPGVAQLNARPTRKFDGIICTDVMEHIDKEDIFDVLGDIMSLVIDDSAGFVYFHICCRPAWKHFKDGSNLHKTVEPEAWWEERLAPFRSDKSNVKIVATYEAERETDTDHFAAIAAEEAAAQLTNKHAKKLKAGLLGDEEPLKEEPFRDEPGPADLGEG